MPAPLAALLDALAAAGIPAHVQGDPAVTIEDIAYDSRKVAPDGLFVALRGAATDGHRYIPQALDRGAVAALTEEPVVDPRLRCDVVVPDSRAALAQVAAAFYGEPSRRLGLVGVTGTKGKTTTSFLIEALLAVAGHETGLIGTVDLKVGPRRWPNPVHQTTPESLDVQRFLAEMVAAGVDWAVLETSSHALETHRVDRCLYDVAVVTNVTHEHLDFHGTYENYLAAKAKLLDRFAPEGVKGRPRAAFLNLDDPGAASLRGRARGVPEYTYGLGPACDVRAEAPAESPAGLRFTLRSPWGDGDLALPLLGRFNVYNALAATAVALALGVPLAAVARSLAAFGGVPGRLQRIDEGQPFLVVVDYAHNPDSLEQVLRLLRALARGRLIAVFGSAGDRDRAKRAMMGRVCAALADYGIFTDEDPRTEDRAAILAEIGAGAAAAGWVAGRDYETIPDRPAALARACDLAGPGDVVLLAGKGHENSIEYDGYSIPWDEAAAAREALRALGYGAR